MAGSPGTAYAPSYRNSAAAPFRDWAADHGVEFEVAEQCLEHAVGNSVTQAYLRTTVLERCRKVMTDWAAFLTGEKRDGRAVQGQRR
jgi:hypothetical protein